MSATDTVPPPGEARIRQITDAIWQVEQTLAPGIPLHVHLVKGETAALIDTGLAATYPHIEALSKVAMKQSVRVNAVAPGPVWTPLIPSTMPEERVKKFGGDTAFGRAAQPVEIAPVFVFLASNESRYVSGEVYGVTGGKMPY